MPTMTGQIAPSLAGNPITDQLKAFERDPLRFLLDARRRHGDVVRLHLWPELFHLISHPHGIHRVLVANRANYHDMTPAEASVSPAALAGRVGGALHPARAPELAATVTAAVEAMLGRWHPHAETGRPLDLAQEMVPLSLTIFCQSLFGARLEEDELTEAGTALTVALGGAAPHLRISGFQRLALSRAGPDPKLAAAAHTLDRLVARLIDERRQAGRGRDDVLTMLVFGRDQAAPGALSERQLREAVLVFLLAGLTTSRVLAWTIYLLAGSAQARLRLETELDGVLGRRTAAPADLPDLPYTRMVLQEAMRIYPPLWMLAPRMATADDEIAGYRIPARSLILISPYVTHRHPEFWVGPEVFDPDRFAGDPRPMAYLPFGAGPWGCIGTQFAQLQARLILATLAQRYRWQLARERPVEPEPRASLWPRGGLSMTLHERAPSPAPGACAGRRAVVGSP